MILYYILVYLLGDALEKYGKRTNRKKYTGGK